MITLIEPIVNSDLKIKYQLFDNLNPANYCKFDPLTFPNITKLWQISQQQRFLGGIAAFVDGKMIGLVLVKIMGEEKSAEVLSLFVLPEYRGWGIGSSLMQYLKKFLVKLSCPKLKLPFDN